MKNKILQQIARYSKSSFVRSAGKLVSGTAFAQLISIGTAPILYRIYAKEDYGTLGLYMAITGVLGTFSTLQYTQAVLIEKEDHDALQVLWLVRAINLGLAVIVAFVVLLADGMIANAFNNPSVAIWLYLMPLSIFFSGQNELFRIWANRKKEYSIMMWNTMLTAILVPVVSISFGLLSNSPLGLFLGLLTSQAIPALYLGWKLSKTQSFGWHTLEMSKVKSMAKRHIAFAKYSLPADFINRFSNQLPVFMLSTYSGPAVVGVYNLSMRMLGLPISFLSGAIGEVFKQRATEDYHRLGNCRSIFVSLFKTLLVIAFGPLIVILLFGPDLFAFVFGEQWREAGLFSQMLAIFFFFKLIVSPLTYMYVLKKRLIQDLYNNLYLLITSAIIFSLIPIIDLELVLLLFAMNYSLIYSIVLYRSYYHSINQSMK